MGKIEQNGFLSEEIQQWVEKHRRDNTKWFSLCEEINKFSHKVMLATEVHENDLIELIAATLLVRAMSNFQGTHLQYSLSIKLNILLSFLFSITFFGENGF
jgi:hypothetical protein